MLYRVFASRPGAGPEDEGGPLYVARPRQGAGRHDSPADYGALYGSSSPVSAVAERIQGFRGHVLADEDFANAQGWPLALAQIDDTALGGIVDLDEPGNLLRRGLRPSLVVTRDRAGTQQMARSLFAEGIPGLRWWSTLESSWSNATLFAERAIPHVAVVAEPEILSVASEPVRAASAALGIRLAR